MKIKEILSRQSENMNVAIKYKNEEVSYHELYKKAFEHSVRISTIEHNRNIGICFNNSLDYAIGYFSVAISDSVIIPLEPTINKEMFQSLLNYCEISLIITNDENYDKLCEMLVDFTYKVVIYNISSREASSHGGNITILQGNDDEDDVAIMLHTSGTTSDPKKVMLTNCNLISNIESNIESLNITKDDVCLIVLPMFFGYCNSSQFLSHLYVGAKIVIFDSIYSPKRFLRMIDEEKCTNTTCVPSMLFLIVNNTKRNDFSLMSLRYLCFGGGVMPVDMLKKIIAFFENVEIIQTYGQTEASPRVTCLKGEDVIRKIGSVGKAIPNVIVEVFNMDDKAIPYGEIGQIVVKGPNVMKGYYKKEDITNETLRNGWLHTGDLGRFDEEGYLYVVGRIKNIIISGGLNIYPEEIEEVLINHPAVKEVVVVGEKHKILGEIPIAKVVLKENVSIDERIILQYCTQKLEVKKVPGKVVICDQLDKTYTGKIKRN